MEIEEELVSDTELAVLVLNYINKQGWLATAAALKSEAAEELGTFAHDDEVPGVKNLHDVVTEYILLRQKESKLEELKASNPLAASILKTLEYHADQAGAAAGGEGEAEDELPAHDALSQPPPQPQPQPYQAYKQYHQVAAIMPPTQMHQVVLPRHMVMQQVPIPMPVQMPMQMPQPHMAVEDREYAVQEMVVLPPDYDYPPPSPFHGMPSIEQQQQQQEEALPAAAPSPEHHQQDEQNIQQQQQQQQVQQEQGQQEEEGVELSLGGGDACGSLPPLSPAQPSPSKLSNPPLESPLGDQQQEQQQQVVEGEQEQGHQEQEQPQLTPGRHVMRKSKPKKRRKLDGDFATAAAAAGGVGSLGNGDTQLEQGTPAAGLKIPEGLLRTGANMDILNLPLNEDGLAAFFGDDGMQSRFAASMAEMINAAAAGATAAAGPQPHLPTDTPETSLFGFPTDYDDNSLNAFDLDDIIAGLPADPSMMEVLQQVVKPSGRDDGGLLSPDGNGTAPSTGTIAGEEEDRFGGKGKGKTKRRVNPKPYGYVPKPRNQKQQQHQQQQEEVVEHQMEEVVALVEEPKIEVVGAVKLRRQDVNHIINATLGGF